jgi:hypothetical protein
MSAACFLTMNSPKALWTKDSNAAFSVLFALSWKQCLDALGLYRRVFAKRLRPALLIASLKGRGNLS